MTRFLNLLAAGVCLLAIVIPAHANEPVNVNNQTEHIIEIVNFKFSPPQLSVNSGDIVTWINRDVVSHNIADDKLTIWRSPDLRKGKTFSIVLTDDLYYVCSLHAASMKGSILMHKNHSTNTPMVSTPPVIDAEPSN